MSRKLKFDLDIDASALLQANSEAFYSRAYLNEEVVDNYRTLPGVKYKTKISNVVFGQVLQAENCGFNASTDDLLSVEIDVCSLSAMAQICQFDLEQSFVSLQMTKGSNGDFTVASFMDYYWNEMSKTIAENIEKLRWSGDTASGTAALALCDGYIKGLVADSANVIEVGGATPPAITPYNGLDAVIEIPYGSYPGNMPGEYYSDEEHLMEWLKTEKDPKAFKAFIDKNIFNTKSFYEYLELNGGMKKILKLKQIEHLITENQVILNYKNQ